MNNSDIKNFKDHYTNDNSKIILYGAGQLGKLALFALNKKNINVDYFCDSDRLKQNKQFYGVDVIPLNKLKEKSEKIKVFISNIYIEEVLKDLKKSNINEVYECVSLFDNTTFEGFDSQHDASMDDAFNHKPIDIERILTGYKRKVKTSLNNSKDKLYLSHIDISITERCSMKCKDCANLMQYYAHAKNSDTEKLIVSIKKLMSAIDHVNELRILGGEPFMNKDLFKIVNHVVEYQNINSVILYSNATIIPKGENLNCLKNKKIKLDITNYGDLSINHEKIIEIYKKQGISHTSQIARYWTDSGTIKFRNRKAQDNAEVFKNCCVNDTYTVLNGKLYGCPFSSHSHNLNLIKMKNTDFIDLLDDQKSISDTKKELEYFMNRKKNNQFLTACGYCAGRDNTVPKVKAAIQTKTFRTYNQLEENIKVENSN